MSTHPSPTSKSRPAAVARRRPRCEFPGCPVRPLASRKSTWCAYHQAQAEPDATAVVFARKLGLVALPADAPVPETLRFEKATRQDRSRPKTVYQASLRDPFDGPVTFSHVEVENSNDRYTKSPLPWQLSVVIDTGSYNGAGGRYGRILLPVEVGAYRTKTEAVEAAPGFVRSRLGTAEARAEFLFAHAARDESARYTHELGYAAATERARTLRGQALESYGTDLGDGAYALAVILNEDGLADRMSYAELRDYADELLEDLPAEAEHAVVALAQNWTLGIDALLDAARGIAG